MAVIKRTTVEFDVMQLDKSKFIEFKRKDGSVAKMCSVELIETDKTSVVVKKDGTPVRGKNSLLTNIGFVVQSSTKEDRENKKEMPIIGNGKRWVENDDSNQTSPDDNGDSLSLDQIPF